MSYCFKCRKMDPHTRITQKELAERLHLSQATVSRALSKSPLLPAGTVRKVWEEAEKVGYRPDPALASLNAYLHARRPISQGSLIAWLGRYPAARMADPAAWVARVFQAAKSRGEELGYKVDYFWMGDPKVPSRRLQQILETRGVQGVVLDTQTRSHGHLRFSVDRCSVVAIGRTLHFPKVDQISPDHFCALVTCYRKLLRMGYRRIGLAVSRSFNERSMGHWHAAYLLEQVRKKAFPAIPILTSAEEDKASLGKWLARWKPDCIITAIEEPHSGKPNRADCLRELEVDVPGEIGLAIINNIAESEEMPPFSGIIEPLREIGEAALNVLVSRIRHNLRGVPEARTVSLIEGKWHDGRTVRAKI